MFKTLLANSLSKKQFFISPKLMIRWWPGNFCEFYGSFTLLHNVNFNRKYDQSLLSSKQVVSTDPFFINLVYIKCRPPTQFPQIQFPLTWFPLTWFPLTWYPLTWFPLTWFLLTWFPLTWFPLMWFPLTWFP